MFYVLIFVIRESEILISVIRDSLFFRPVNRARDPPLYDPQLTLLMLNVCVVLKDKRLANNVCRLRSTRRKSNEIIKCNFMSPVKGKLKPLKFC